MYINVEYTNKETKFKKYISIMGERISFATTNWKDKPGKPDCMTQGEWDALNSSKFNGLPFASPILTGFVDLRATYDQELTTLENGLNSITQPYVDADRNITNRFGEQIFPLVSGFIDKISGSKYVQSSLPCDKMQYQLWSGQYYEYNRSIEKKCEFNCSRFYDNFTKYDYLRTMAQVGIRFKIPSNSTTEITPVCGPGTSAIEIDKALAINLVWRLKELELDSSTFSITTNMNGTAPGSLMQDTFQGSFSFRTDQKTAGQSALSGYNESQIINQKWEESPNDRFTASGTVNNLIGDCVPNYLDMQVACQNTITNASFNASSSWQASPELGPHTYTASIRLPNIFEVGVELLPFNERKDAIISIQDGSQTKYFLDFNKLIFIKSFETRDASDRLGSQRRTWSWSDRAQQEIDTESRTAPRILFGNIESNIGLPKKDDDAEYRLISVRGHSPERGQSKNSPKPPDPVFPLSWWFSCATETETFGFNHVNVTINLLGTDVIVPLTVPYSRGCGDYYNQTTTTAGAIKIKGKSYYEYANSAGEAVYDKDTGAQLKDPLS